MINPKAALIIIMLIGQMSKAQENAGADCKQQAYDKQSVENYLSHEDLALLLREGILFWNSDNGLQVNRDRLQELGLDVNVDRILDTAICASPQPNRKN